MNAGGLAPVSKNDACTLIVNFFCLTAPEMSKYQYPARNCGEDRGMKSASCKVITVDRDSRIRPVHPHTPLSTTSPYLCQYCVSIRNIRRRTQQLKHNGRTTRPLSYGCNRKVHGRGHCRPQQNPWLRCRRRRQVRADTLLSRKWEKRRGYQRAHDS